MQVARPRVVAQPLPQPQHLVFLGFGQMGHSGETFHKLLPIGHALADTGLLQNHLAQPDRVGVGGVAPGQVAPVAGIPSQQRWGKGVLVGIRGHTGFFMLNASYKSELIWSTP